MNNYNKFGGKYVSHDLSNREIAIHLNKGGFEPARGDVETMSIGGYLPETPDDNPCFGYTINGEDTGYEWRWLDMPRSFRTKLWKAAIE